MSKFKNYFGGLTRNTFFLAVASLFSDISTEMLYPILPVFLVQYFGATGSIIGLIEGMAQSTQDIVQGFSGWLADKLGKRKAIALVGYFLAAISKPLIGLATVWQGVLGARTLDRLGAGIRTAPRDALVAASVDSMHRGKAFGLEGTGDNLGAFIGPLLTIALLAIITNLHVIFYLALIPGLLALLMVLLVKIKKPALDATTKTNFSIRQFPLSYWKYVFAIGLFIIGNSSNVFLILQSHYLGFSLRGGILIYTAFNLVAALISYPAGFLSDHYGRRNMVIASFTIFTISYLGFAMSKTRWLIAVCFIMYGLHQGIFRAVAKVKAIDFVPERLHASAFGCYNTILGILQLFSSVMAGILWDHVSHSAVFYVGAIGAIVSSLALLWLVPSIKHPAAF